jgi:hypothetical protein
MEAGGLITEVGWTEFDFLSHGEESEVMAQLLGAFPSHGQEGHHDQPWSDQASSVQPAYEGYYLSNSNEALGMSSCIAVDDMSLVLEYGATEFVSMLSNHSSNFYGDGGDRSCEDLDGPNMSMLGSASASNKRKHLAEEADGQTRVSLRDYPF